MRKFIAPLLTIALLSGSYSAIAQPQKPASELAYPQTKPNAGQYCKKKYAGKITKAKNGRKVKCKKVGTRYRWQYVKS